MDGVRSVVRALRTSTRVVERETGMSAAQLFVLQCLDGAPGASINELAELTGTHQSSVSVVVSRLTEKGYVLRRAAPDDARRMQVELTDDGRATLDGAPVTVQRRLLSALRSMPADRVEEFAATLEAWLREAGVPHDAPPMFFEEAE